MDLTEPGNLTESEHWRLRTSESTPSPFHGLPKKRFTCQEQSDKQFTNFVSSHVVAEDEQIVPFDVVSLFTSVPVDLAINIVQGKLDESTE